MKKLGFLLLGCIAAFSLTTCSGKYADASGDLITAAAITNSDLIRLSREMRDVGDRENTVAPASNQYAIRLSQMTDRLRKEDGLDLNFKVYLTKDINANATADGSIRVYSGLMDMMTNDELFYVIGHEIAHVKNQDSLNQVRKAYLSSGIIKAAGASNRTVGALTNSELGGLLHVAINAQYSQQAEYAADEYGYNMMKKYRVNTQGAVTALRKIDSLGKSGGFLSSHPNSADRANRLEKLIQSGK